MGLLRLISVSEFRNELSLVDQCRHQVLEIHLNTYHSGFENSTRGKVNNTLRTRTMEVVLYVGEVSH